jgi:tRNA A-37 threonylcarbamoyl transferase component Bud32
MSTPDADGIAQLARRLDLVTDDQLMDAWAELGSRTGPAEPLLRALERKGHLTPWQASKLLKGDTDGYVLGGYRLLYRIAAGSFGRVYRGDNPRTGEVVAIKVLRKRWAEDNRKIELFEREGKVGLAMQHPNIVRILAVNRDPASGQYYLVMEFVEGGNLRDFLAIRKKLEAPEALRLLEETASGLAYALTQGLTHRDLKPTNILISATQTAKLVDFGLAELAGGAREVGGEIDRTVDYAGLEKATGVKAGDPRSDIYFLGTTFHEMVTGRPLLSVIREARARMLRQRFEIDGQLRRDDPDLPAPVFSLLSRMVAFDPNARFQTYEQLLDAIHQVRAEVEGRGKATAAAGPKTVFVVETNAKFQHQFREKLKARGYRVLISINAGQAVTRFHQQPYHALVVDCATGDRTGLDAFEKVMREADLKRMDCAGLLILSPEQAHWAETIDHFPKSAVLTMPVNLKQILQKLKDLAPLGEAVVGTTDD